MKINVKYDPKDWEASSKRFVPKVLEDLETSSRAEYVDKMINFKYPLSYSLSNSEMFMIDCLRIIQFEMFEALPETIRIGKKYAEIALKNDCRLIMPGKKGKYSEIGAKTKQNELLLFFDWVSLKKVNKEYIDNIFEVEKKVFNEKTDEKNENRKKVAFNFIVNAFYLLLYGNIELARIIQNGEMRCKKTRYLTENIIYDKKKFYSYIVGAIVNPSNEEFKREVERIMLYFLEERRKGNIIVSRALYGYTPECDVEIIVLWYKYFSSYNYDEISPYEIIQASRYGVRGHEDMEQLEKEGKEREWWKKFYN